jgi:ADP-ribosyl-[dinitrogen reductase] hydrolase
MPIAGRPAPDRADRFRGCLLGLAVGDAVGTTVEFKPRGSFDPVTDMVGGGPFRLEPGEWTDDTSMALCLAASLVERGGFDARDQMERYRRWYESGYMSVRGRCFDIGGTTRRAIESFARTGDPCSGPDDALSAGNGSLMRLAPVVLRYHGDRKLAIALAAESSRTTHRHPECVAACRILADLLHRTLDGADREQLLPALPEEEHPAVLRPIAAGEFVTRPEAAIRSTGYVAHTLEAALWCFLRSDSFEGAVLAAANLGHDADTTAAVCGQVAGAYYGASEIPSRWLDRLAWRAEIETLADRLREASLRASGDGR